MAALEERVGAREVVGAEERPDVLHELGRKQLEVDLAAPLPRADRRRELDEEAVAARLVVLEPLPVAGQPALGVNALPWTSSTIFFFPIATASSSATHR